MIAMFVQVTVMEQLMCLLVTGQLLRYLEQLLIFQ